MQKVWHGYRLLHLHIVFICYLYIANNVIKVVRLRILRVNSCTCYSIEKKNNQKATIPKSFTKLRINETTIFSQFKSCKNWCNARSVKAVSKKWEVKFWLTLELKSGAVRRVVVQCGACYNIIYQHLALQTCIFHWHTKTNDEKFRSLDQIWMRLY